MPKEDLASWLTLSIIKVFFSSPYVLLLTKIINYNLFLFFLLPSSLVGAFDICYSSTLEGGDHSGNLDQETHKEDQG